MKGILLKDFYNLQGQLKMYLIFPILGLFMAYMQHSVIIMIFMLGILIVSVPMSAFAYDDMADFSTYALTMPIDRRDLVLSKYVLSFLITIVCGLVSLAFIFVLFQILDASYFDGVTIPYAFQYTILYMFAMNAVNCILLPLNFKFGTEKGRIFFFLIFFAIGGIGYLLNYLSTLLDPSLVRMIVEGFNQYGIYIIVVAVIVLETVSILISTRILKKKEY